MECDGQKGLKTNFNIVAIRNNFDSCTITEIPAVASKDICVIGPVVKSGLFALCYSSVGASSFTLRES